MHIRTESGLLNLKGSAWLLRQFNDRKKLHALLCL
jgi:hypothetical protein